MYDFINIGSLVIVFVDVGGFGGIVYALRVEHPYPQYFQQVYGSKACWCVPWRLGDGCGCSSFLFFVCIESWRLDLSFG